MPVTRPPRLPRPSWDDLSARSELSTARQRVLEAVEAAHRPLTAAEVAKELGLHHNTVREHLDALVEGGFVTTTKRPTGRRGRPSLLYTSTAPDPGEVLDSYLALLDAVAVSLAGSTDPTAARAAARAVGRRWAEQMHADTGTGGLQSLAPRAAGAEEPGTPCPEGLDPTLAALVPELSVMGFAPEAAGDALVLKACPLVTGRRVPHELVCHMHEGYLSCVMEERARAGVADQDTPRQAADGGAESAPGCAGSRLSVVPLVAEGCRITLRPQGVAQS